MVTPRSLAILAATSLFASSVASQNPAPDGWKTGTAESAGLDPVRLPP